MSREDVEAYLAALDEPKQSTLRALRRTIVEIVPDAGHATNEMGTLRKLIEATDGFAA